MNLANRITLLNIAALFFLTSQPQAKAADSEAHSPNQIEESGSVDFTNKFDCAKSLAKAKKLAADACKRDGYGVKEFLDEGLCTPWRDGYNVHVGALCGNPIEKKAVVSTLKLPLKAGANLNCPGKIFQATPLETKTRKPINRQPENPEWGSVDCEISPGAALKVMSVSPKGYIVNLTGTVESCASELPKQDPHKQNLFLLSEDAIVKQGECKANTSLLNGIFIDHPGEENDGNTDGDPGVAAPPI